MSVLFMEWVKPIFVSLVALTVFVYEHLELFTNGSRSFNRKRDLYGFKETLYNITNDVRCIHIEPRGRASANVRDITPISSKRTCKPVDASMLAHSSRFNDMIAVFDFLIKKQRIN
jgi:hypothetical protein